MKLQTNGIDHINLDVKNLDESVQFYRDLFGFAILKDQPKAKSKIIGNDTVKLCLYEVEELPLTKMHPGFNHFGLHVHNFNDVRQACKERNVSILNEYDWEKIGIRLYSRSQWLCNRTCKKFWWWFMIDVTFSIKPAA